MVVEEPAGAASVQIVAAIVHHTGRVLTIERYGDGRRQLPRGRARPGESPSDALRRITRTTTGFAVIESGVTGITRNDSGVTVVFRCAIRGVGPDFSDQTTALHWSEPSELAAVSEAPLHGALLRALHTPAPQGAARRVDLAG